MHMIANSVRHVKNILYMQTTVKSFVGFAASSEFTWVKMMLVKNKDIDVANVAQLCPQIMRNCQVVWQFKNTR